MVNAGEALGRIAVRAIQCSWDAEREPQVVRGCIERQIQGLWGAFVGDARLLALVSKESLRLAGTAAGLGACMNALGVETTDQVLRHKLQQVEVIFRENEVEICQAILVMWRLNQDPSYPVAVARAVAEVVAAHLPGLADTLDGAGCSQIIAPVCEAMGIATYEVLLTLVLAVVTFETGGAGGIAKGAQAIAKVTAAAKRSPRLASFLEQVTQAFTRAARRLPDYRATAKAREIFKHGTIFEKTIETARGPVDVLAEVVVSGKTLTGHPRDPTPNGQYCCKAGQGRRDLR